MVNALLVATAALGINGGSLIPRQGSACPALPSCPANNGCTWQDPNNGAKFVVACSIDLLGGDFETVRATSYADCLNACAVTQTCIAVSYKSDASASGGFCYLKSTIKPAVSNSAIAAASISGVPKAVATSTPTAFCNGAISCPVSDNCKYSAGASALRQKVFVIACSRDLYGGDLKAIPSDTMNACVDSCALLGNCVAVSYKASTKTCYLKSSQQPALYNTDITGAYIKAQ